MAIDTRDNLQEWFNELSEERDSLVQQKSDLEDSLAKIQQRSRLLGELSNRVGNDGRQKLNETFGKTAQEQIKTLKAQMEAFDEKNEERLSILNFVIDGIEERISSL